MLTERLAGGLQALGLAVISPREDGAWSGIIAAKVPGLPELEYSGWLKKLREMGITANYRMGNLRFSPHGYNNLADIDRLLGAIQRLIEN
jgi:selenocysteine lyase/cysteine desulfurase